MCKKLLYLLLLTTFSCQKEIQEISDIGSKIVINGLLTTDSLIGINVSSSLKIDDTISVQKNFINNAKLEVYENGFFQDSLKHIEVKFLGNFYQVPNNYNSKILFPQSGKSYTLKITAPGKSEVEAVTTIPNLVKIEKVDTSRIQLSGVSMWESKIKVHYKIYFTDPVEENNFYLFYIYIKHDDNIPYLIYEGVTYESFAVEEELKHGSYTFGISFSDRSINGRQHSISGTIAGKDIGFPFWDDNDVVQHFKTVIYFRLYSITEEYFKYIQTLNLFFKNYKNPLAEPTQVYSNIKGGYGIFSGASVSSDSIVFTH